MAEPATPSPEADDGGGYAPAWVQSVTPAAIVDQRSKGWPDFHPEDFCHRCGRRNPCWSAESEAWFTAYPQARGSDGGGIWCPSCFADDYEAEAMERADAFVLLLPCGRSAHLELGWAVGAGKRTAILLEDPAEPELMYRMVDRLAPSLLDLLGWLGVED